MSESTGFSAAEQAAIAERAQELRAQRGGRKKADALQDLLAKIEARPGAAEPGDDAPGASTV